MDGSIAFPCNNYPHEYSCHDDDDDDDVVTVLKLTNEANVAEYVVVVQSFSMKCGREKKNNDDGDDGNSATRFGDFYEFFATNCITKEAPKIGDFLGRFLIMSLLCKKCVATFWPILGKIRQLFFNIIWSHWSHSTLNYL